MFPAASLCFPFFIKEGPELVKQGLNSVDEGGGISPEGETTREKGGDRRMLDIWRVGKGD